MDVVKLLLQDSRVDPSSNNSCTILYVSTYRQYLETSLIFHTTEVLDVMKLLLQDSRVDPNLRIQYASEFGYTELVQSLLKDSRVDPSSCNYAIQKAAKNGHEETVKLLLQDSRVDPLLQTQFASDVKHVECLLKDSSVDPAIQETAKNVHEEIVKLLFQDSPVNPILRQTKQGRYSRVNTYKSRYEMHHLDRTKPVNRFLKDEGVNLLWTKSDDAKNTTADLIKAHLK
jgi:ankyrin repeat protein